MKIFNHEQCPLAVWLKQYRKAVSNVKCGMREVEALTNYKLSVKVDES